MRFHIAQANVSYSIAPIRDPAMREFVDRLDEINRLAEQGPGFVWRYVSDSRSDADREFEDPLILFNMTVWESIEALHAFTYRTAHAPVFAARKRWFVEWGRRNGHPSYVLWWIEAETRPDAEEGKRRLRRLGEQGPSPEAFTFKASFPAPF